MPLFEYQCKNCGHRFEALIVGNRQPVCPRCAGTELEKQCSTFGLGGSGRAFGTSTPSRPSCSTGGG